MKKMLIGSMLLGAALSVSAQNPTLMSHCVLKQDAQTRVVEVSYEMTGDEPLYVTLEITTNGVPITDLVAVTGDITSLQNPAAIEPGLTPKKIYWNAKQDWPGNLTTEACATVTGWFTNDPPASLILAFSPDYVVVDLSGGPSAVTYPVRASASPPNLSDPLCKTTELWLRRIPAGTFMMGSPGTELGRDSTREIQHEVTLTQDFYIGVFPVTQKQYELVMPQGAGNPSAYVGDMRPVERVSYEMIRGKVLGAEWPVSDHVDATSFMGRLRARAPFLFDLPTDAQWEYACRAGTTTALYSGSNLTNIASCPNVQELARCKDNGGSSQQHAVVGSYLPNAWGLYDMYGNVWEWCLDRFTVNLGTTEVTNPKGHASETLRTRHGGSFNSPASECRSAFRFSGDPTLNNQSTYGFRVCIQPPEGYGN